MKMISGICCFIALLGITARAGVEKVAVPCSNGICLYWWPKLPQLKGWHQDKDQSFNYGVNAMAPDGSSFVNSESVIYARAEYKPRVPETKSLGKLIADDRKDFLASDPDITISEVSAFVTGDGVKMRSFTFFPKSKGNWELVSYGEEGDYYLIFTLSSRSKEGFDKAQNAYRELIAHYKVNL
ncbi:MAG: hypothetical protein WA663_07345 [Candidatus Acidiferrales bacterium]